MLYSKEVFSYDDFTSGLQIECENRSRDVGTNDLVNKVHYVSLGENSGNTTNFKASKAKKRKMFKVNKKFFGIAKKDRACFHYEKSGHYIRKCKFRNNNRGNEGVN
ncbi:hypothetical protein LIER_37731 [Lithospermum erythrorhizon]|uniref:Uncharacterized protein n=1 Tax=Lithospermum erythrorhizon TaxID=34254 RepID=A0AAV3PTV4_LITER